MYTYSNSMPPEARQAMHAGLAAIPLKLQETKCKLLGADHPSASRQQTSKHFKHTRKCKQHVANNKVTLFIAQVVLIKG